MPRCAATSSKTGKKCKHNAKAGEIYCASHLNMNKGSPVTPLIPKVPMATIMETDDDGDCDPSFILQVPVSSVHLDKTPVAETLNNVVESVHVPHNAELAYLRSLNAIYEEVIAKLTRALQEKKGSTKVKRSRKLDEKTMVKVAKQLYYKEHKRTPSIIEEIKSRFDQGGMGEVTSVPWQLVKHVTDKFFDALALEERDMYLALARQTLIATQT